MVVRAVSGKCLPCHCMITEFRLVWEQWCANAEVFQNPTLLICCSKHSCYFKDTLKISTGINGQWFNKVKSVLSLSVVCNLEQWYGLGDREPGQVVHFGEGFSTCETGAQGLFHSSTAVQLLPSSCTRYLWCSSSSESCPLGNRSNMLVWSVLWKEGFVWICEKSMACVVWISH